MRGRQYKSLAEEINNEILTGPATSALMADQLGFNVDDVRAVRRVALDLLNERFFGARDRLADAAAAGVAPDAPAADSTRRDLNLMLNKCRLFGSVTAKDVADALSITEARASRVLDYFSVKPADAGRPDPLQQFFRGRVPSPWGSIKDDGAYVLLNGFLGEDELRRNVERTLKSNSRTWPRYDRRRAACAEAMAASALGQLLGGAAPRWTGQHYLAPDASSAVADLNKDATLGGVAYKSVESDALFIQDGVALCVEVKAGVDGAAKLMGVTGPVPRGAGLVLVATGRVSTVQNWTWES